MRDIGYRPSLLPSILYQPFIPPNSKFLTKEFVKLSELYRQSGKKALSFMSVYGDKRLWKRAAIMPRVNPRTDETFNRIDTPVLNDCRIPVRDISRFDIVFDNTESWIGNQARYKKHANKQTCRWLTIGTIWRKNTYLPFIVTTGKISVNYYMAGFKGTSMQWGHPSSTKSRQANAFFQQKNYDFSLLEY